MKKIILLLYIFFSLCKSTIAQSSAPEWIDGHRRRVMFPKNEFILGFSSEEYSRKDDIKELFGRLEGYAKAELTESVLTTIRSISITNILNLNQSTLEQFRKSSVSYSELKLTGLQIEQYKDEKKRVAYTIAYAKIADISSNYEAIIQKHKVLIHKKITSAERFLAKKNKILAFKNYFETLPSFREIEKAQTLLVALYNKDLYHDSSHHVIYSYKIKVQEAISSFQEMERLNMNEFASLMARVYKIQTGIIKSPISLHYFKYQDSEMTSPFSKKLNAILEKKFADIADYFIIKNTQSYNKDTAKFTLTGTYWEEKDQLKVLSILRNRRDGKNYSKYGRINR